LQQLTKDEATGATAALPAVTALAAGEAAGVAAAITVRTAACNTREAVKKATTALAADSTGEVTSLSSLALVRK
jgi:hypothetical protein